MQNEINAFISYAEVQLILCKDNAKAGENKMCQAKNLNFVAYSCYKISFRISSPSFRMIPSLSSSLGRKEKRRSSLISGRYVLYYEDRLIKVVLFLF